jgi:acetyl esterase
MTTTSQPTTPLPGRLGNPATDLRSDPRADPRMVATLAPFGLDTAAEAPPVDARSPREAQLAYLAEAETGFEGLFAALTEGLPPTEGVTRTTDTITAPGGH